MIPTPPRDGWPVAALLALLVFWAPLPWASVTPAGTLVLRSGAAGLLVLAVLTSGSAARGLRHVGVAAAALAAVGLLGLLQASPWPPGLVAAASPEHLELFKRAREVSGAEDGAAWTPLSLAPAASRSAALSWVMAGAVLAAAAVAGRHRRHRRWLALAVAAAAGVQLIWGAAVTSGAAADLGLPVHRPDYRLRGTFTNPNHLAVFLEMALAVLFAWGWWGATRRYPPVGVERRLLLAGPPWVLWCAVVVALAVSGSRAGLAAAVLGTAVQALLLARWRRRAGPALLGAAAAAAAAVGALLVARRGLARFLTLSLFEDNLQARLQVAPKAAELWRRFPWTGTGLGSFQDAFGLVQPPELTGMTWDRAHNDYLELLVTGGLMGVALLLVAAAALATRLVRLAGTAKRTEDRAAVLAAAGAIAAVVFHEAFDFGLSLPANAFTAAALVGAVAGLQVGDAVGGRPRAASRDAATPAPDAAPGRPGP